MSSSFFRPIKKKSQRLCLASRSARHRTPKVCCTCLLPLNLQTLSSWSALLRSSSAASETRGSRGRCSCSCLSPACLSRLCLSSTASQRLFLSSHLLLYSIHRCSDRAPRGAGIGKMLGDQAYTQNLTWRNSTERRAAARRDAICRPSYHTWNRQHHLSPSTICANHCPLGRSFY